MILPEQIRKTDGDEEQCRIGIILEALAPTAQGIIIHLGRIV